LIAELKRPQMVLPYGKFSRQNEESRTEQGNNKKEQTL
jgi:hypothetical protein